MLQQVFDILWEAAQDAAQRISDFFRRIGEWAKEVSQKVLRAYAGNMAILYGLATEKQIRLHVPSEAENSEEVVSHHPAPHPQVFENGGGSMKEQPYILQLDRRTFYGCHGRAWQDGPFRWDYRKASSFYRRFVCIYGFHLGVATKRQIHLVEHGKPRTRKKWLRIIRKRIYKAFGMETKR